MYSSKYILRNIYFIRQEASIDIYFSGQEASIDTPWQGGWRGYYAKYFKIF